MRSSAFTWVFILLCMIGLVLLQAPLSFSQAQYDTSPQAQTG